MKKALLPAGWIKPRGYANGVAATGRPVMLRVIGMLRLARGKIAEGWFEFDTGELYAQLRADSDVSAKDGA